MPLSHTKNSILVVLLLSPILLHFSLISLLSLNIPWVDDFAWYFDFFKQLDTAKGVEEFSRTVATPYNGHWHIVQRLVLIAVTRIGLPINSIYFVVVGNLLFLALFYFLFVNKKSRELSIATVAAAWLFFQPISHYNFFECAFFNLPVLLFSMLAIRACCSGRNTAILWAILATISNGNGLLIWPILILIAFWNRDWKKLISTGVFFTLVTSLYLFASKGMKGGGKLDAENILDIALYFVQLCGRILPGTEFADPWLSIGLGVLILIFFLLITPVALRNQQPLYFFMLFILMSMLLVSLTRKSVVGFSAQIVNHYLLFPQLLVGCLVYYFLEEHVRNHKWKTLSLIVVVLFSGICVVVKLPDLIGHQALKIGNALNYEISRKWLLYPPVQGVDEYLLANRSTAYATSRGIYELPVFSKNFLAETCSCQQNSEGDVRVEASLEKRILNRQLFIELTDKSSFKSFYPVDPYTSSVVDWVKRRKNRRVDTVFYLHFMPEPIIAKDVVGCRLFTID